MMYRVVINPEVAEAIHSIPAMNFNTRPEAEAFMEAFGGVAHEVAGLLGVTLPEDISTLKEVI